MNRVYDAQGLLAKKLDAKSLISGAPRPYKVSLVTNKSQVSEATVLNVSKSTPAIWRENAREMSIHWPILRCRFPPMTRYIAKTTLERIKVNL